MCNQTVPQKQVISRPATLVLGGTMTAQSDHRAQTAQRPRRPLHHGGAARRPIAHSTRAHGRRTCAGIDTEHIHTPLDGRVKLVLLADVEALARASGREIEEGKEAAAA